MLQQERIKTTNWAEKKLNKFLKECEYFSALILANIVVNLRLRTLITLRLSPTKDWQKTSNLVDSLYGTNKMINLCEKLELLPVNFKAKPLKTLYSERCILAHETELWKEDELSDKKIKKITELCMSAIDFLKKTTD